MAELAQAAHIPIPEIEDDGGCVTVRFRHGQFIPEPRGSEMNPAERREAILALLDRVDKVLRYAIFALLWVLLPPNGR